MFIYSDIPFRYFRSIQKLDQNHVGNPMINLPFGGGFYHPFLVILCDIGDRLALGLPHHPRRNPAHVSFVIVISPSTLPCHFPDSGRIKSDSETSPDCATWIAQLFGRIAQLGLRNSQDCATHFAQLPGLRNSQDCATLIAQL